MTGSDLLAHLKSVLEAALPGWTIHAQPQSLPGDRSAELVVLRSTAGVWQMSGPALLEQIGVRLTRRMGDAAAYTELLDARDAVVRAVHDDTANLMAQGVEPYPDGRTPGLEGPLAVGDPRADGYWMVEIVLPLRRQL